MGFVFPHRAKMLELSWVYKDVIRLRLERPFNFRNKIGQAVALSIDKPGYDLDVAPFTLTNFYDSNFLEFIIKIRQNKDGITYGLSQLKPGDTLLVSHPWDTYTYLGEGIFIAAGTGIIPFIAIFRYLQKHGGDEKTLRRNLLFYSCRTKEDVLFENELLTLLGNNYIKILSRQDYRTIHSGRIDRQLLTNYIGSHEKPFYVCGPSSFELAMKSALTNMGVTPGLIQTGHRV